MMIIKFSDFQVNESKSDELNSKLNNERHKKAAKLDAKIAAVRKCFLHDPGFVTKAMGFKVSDLAEGTFVFEKEIKKCDYPHTIDIDKLLSKMEKMQRTLGDSYIGVAINKFVK